MYAARIRMLMGNPLYIIVGAHLFSVGLIVLGLGRLNPHPWLVPWGAAVVAVTLLRAVVILHWRRSGVPVERAHRVAFAFTALAMLAGGAWGGGAILFFDPDNLPADALLCLVLIGMATGGMGPIAPYFPAYAGFATMTLLPFSLHLFIYDSLLMWLVGLSGVFYTASCLAACAYLTARIRESVALRYENRHLISDLEAKRQEAERANEAKGRFLAAASHDLRQPLNALSLSVDMLSTVPSGHAREDLIRSIRSSVDATNDLLTGLLDVSRLDAGVVRPEPRVIRLGPLFEQIGEMFGPVALDRNVTLRVRPTSACIHSDPALLGSVLQNLVGNAIRYVPRGGAVLLLARRQSGAWRIEIRDNGPGIPADQQQRIFEDFVRCQPAEVGSGLGLGLAIVRRVTRLLNHDLRLQSRLGRGSVFSIEAPAIDASAVTPPEPRSRGGGGRTLPIPVLLLTSESLNRNRLCADLEVRGMRVSTPASINEARARLETGAIVPRVLVVDGDAHGEFDGIDAIRWLTGRRGPHLPAILLTGEAPSNLRRRARAAGIMLLRKPVTGGRLAEAIGERLPETT
jgi:signal transduction histidine kinase/CheY-like chemotaxis protein